MVAFPADQSVDVPPDQSVVYESPDLLIQIDSVGPSASYIASPVSQEMQFLGYDVIDPLSAPGVSEITSPDGGLEFIASAGTSDFLLSPAFGAPVGGVLQIDIAPGGPPVALAELGPPTGGISLGFADPFADAGTLNVGVPLPPRHIGGLKSPLYDLIPLSSVGCCEVYNCHHNFAISMK